MSNVRVGVYPGTFDPITLGHMDIIRRGAKLVDQLIIGVTTNPSKSPMFSLEERLAMVRRECNGIGPRIEVVAFDALLMDFAEQQGASVIIPIGTKLEEVERVMIRETLKETDGDKSLAAQMLGIAARTIYRKLEAEKKTE